MTPTSTLTSLADELAAVRVEKYDPRPDGEGSDYRDVRPPICIKVEALLRRAAASGEMETTEEERKRLAEVERSISLRPGDVPGTVLRVLRDIDALRVQLASQAARVEMAEAERDEERAMANGLNASLNAVGEERDDWRARAETLEAAREAETLAMVDSAVDTAKARVILTVTAQRIQASDGNEDDMAVVYREINHAINLLTPPSLRAALNHQEAAK